MIRTVLILVPSGEDPKPHQLWIQSAPKVVRPLCGDMQIDPDALPLLRGDAGAAAHGRELYTKLTGHLGVKEILDDLAGRAEVGPIYLQTDSANSELVCWEALNRDGTFRPWTDGRSAGSPARSTANRGSRRTRLTGRFGSWRSSPLTGSPPRRNGKG